MKQNETTNNVQLEKKLSPLNVWADRKSVV